ncbi:hypothetical protein Catovirus_1_988 [Catovirus CTV1]|uniref:C2H2-type domain-containing protein n=1 Tax=Catovirus CTV1 TaxID=1977631 RepID=A0A1V0SBA8_9VIRU|nr:hypothetical protein Catovirus_1_988 [Catovirus CTV1]
MKFVCSLCNYSTNDQANFNKHKKSKKHVEKSNKVMKSTSPDSLLTPEGLSKDSHRLHINNNSNSLPNDKINTKSYKCPNCEIYFSKSCNLSRHLKNCNIKNIKSIEKEFEEKIKENQYQNKLKLLEEKLNSYEIEKSNLQSKYNILESKCNLLENENDFHKQLINAAGGMLQKSVNTMTFLLLNYDNAPLLKQLPDYSMLSKDTETLIKELIHYHNKGTFDKFIGDFIVKQYKKNDPELQALWSSDTERLNYFIRELVKHKDSVNNDANNTPLKSSLSDDKAKWIMDKKGIKVSNYIIEPLLDYIQKIGMDYINTVGKNIDNMKPPQHNKAVNDMLAIGEINCGIKNKSLAKGINKYIAPHFYLNKDNFSKKIDKITT